MTTLVRELPLPATLPAAGHLHVIIIGGGIGGLTLAQGLKKAGVGVAVYERDRTVTSRLQGYRVHINPAGSRALHACLPPQLFAVFDRTCGKPSSTVRFLTEKMGVLLTIDTSGATAGAAQDPVAIHRSVSRITLRQVLLSGLDDVVHFAKTFTHYKEGPDGRIVAHFEDGTWVTGDVLVAADGGGSHVRRQFLPDAARVDTGVAAIAGKVFLDGGNRARIAPLLRDGLALVSAPGGISLFIAKQEIGDLAAEGLAAEGFGGNDDSAAAGTHFDNTRSYLMWALGARRDKLGLGDDAAALDSERLRAIALRVMARWSDGFKDLVRMADVNTISPLAIRTSVPVGPWETKRITLIGDAIHSMTPYRGIGANVALKDAVRLRDALVAVERGERDLIEAIHAYEAEMRLYGFAAVRNSLDAMKRTTHVGPLRRAVSRAVFRLVDRLPTLKRRMFRRMGDE